MKIDNHLTYQEIKPMFAKMLVCGYNTINAIEYIFSLDVKIKLMLSLVSSHRHYSSVLLNGISNALDCFGFFQFYLPFSLSANFCNVRHLLSFMTCSFPCRKFVCRVPISCITKPPFWTIDYFVALCSVFPVFKSETEVGDIITMWSCPF